MKRPIKEINKKDLLPEDDILLRASGGGGSEEEDSSERDWEGGKSLLDVEDTAIAGIKLRKLTIASLTVLQLSNNSFVTKDEVADTELLMTVLRFLVLMRLENLDGETVSIFEAAALARDPEALDLAALELGETLTPSQVEKIGDKIGETLVKAMSGQVKATPPPEAKRRRRGKP